MTSGRYSRQETLKKIGKAGQRKICGSKVVIIGCGALGSSSADLLVRAGVGKVVLVDRDVVDIANIHRQRYYEDDVGTPKAEALAAHLKKVNSDVAVTPMCVDFNSSNADGIVKRGDIVLDGCDNMETRFIINDAAFKNSVPWVYGGAVGTEGMCALFVPPKPCFRCLFPNPPPVGSLETCETAGVLNALTTIISAQQVMLVLQWLLGEARTCELISFDAWGMEMQKVSFRQREGCECCADERYDFLGMQRKRHAVLCGRNAVHISPKDRTELKLSVLAKSLKRYGRVRSSKSVCVLDLADGTSITIFGDGRAILTGTDDIAKARSLYSKYVGD